MAKSMRFRVRRARAVSRALPMQTTPSPSVRLRSRPCAVSSLRSLFLNAKTLTPWCRANRPRLSKNRRVMGASRSNECVGLLRS